MINTYEELISTGEQLAKEYKFTKAFDVFKEARDLDKNNPIAYIAAAKACYLTKQYNASIALHIVGVLLLSDLPGNPSLISTHYFDNAKHIANGILITDESLQKQIMEFLSIDKEHLEYATDAYKYSLLGEPGKASYDTFIEILTLDVYNKFEDAMGRIGIHYINNLIENYPSKEEAIKHLIKNINW
jgi:hypothetical protein